MARVRLAEDEELTPEVAELIRQVQEATGDTTGMRVLAHRPDIMLPFMDFYLRLQTGGRLSRKLVELVRLAIAQVNQCSACLTSRYEDSFQEGLNEELIAALPLSEGSELFTERERAAIAFGRKMARDHWAVADDDFARLYRHFDEEEVVELLMDVAQFIGIGRIFAVIDAMSERCVIPGADSRKRGRQGGRAG